jgi:hypothetical protein
MTGMVEKLKKRKKAQIFFCAFIRSGFGQKFCPLFNDTLEQMGKGFGRASIPF